MGCRLAPACCRQVFGKPGACRIQVTFNRTLRKEVKKCPDRTEQVPWGRVPGQGRVLASVESQRTVPGEPKSQADQDSVMAMVLLPDGAAARAAAAVAAGDVSDNVQKERRCRLCPDLMEQDPWEWGP